MTSKRETIKPSLASPPLLTPRHSSQPMQQPDEIQASEPETRKISVKKITGFASALPQIANPNSGPHSKSRAGSIFKPKLVEQKSQVSPMLSPTHHHNNPNAQFNPTPSPLPSKTPQEFSTSVVKMYKNPNEKPSLFTKSFLSFQYLNQLQTEQFGENANDFFMPSQTPRDWKSRLTFNKKQETLFKTTINEVSQETHRNYSKLLEEKDKRVKMLPPVKIFRNLKELKSEQSVSSRSDLETKTEPNNKTDRSDLNPKPKSKIPEYSTRIRLGKDESYKFFEYPAGDATPRRPNAREGATMTVLGNKVYLYGGVSKDLHQELDVFNAETEIWEKVEQKGDIPPFGRLGHSADWYTNGIVVFGGEKNYNATLRIRDCMNDTRMFMTDTHEWRYLKCYGELVEARRNHIGIVVGKHLVVHGGIDTHGTFLNDLKILDLISCRWTSVEEVDKDTTEAVAFHRACLVVSLQRKDINLLKLPPVRTDDNYQKIAEEGIYFFGGKSENGRPSNSLKLLKIGGTPFRWITPVTQGRPPEPRYAHVMVHSRKLNMLIIHGGRSDSAYSHERSPFLEDFYILQLENMLWVEVDLLGAVNSPRCSHSAVVVGTKMMIFGGINFGKYCPAEHKLIEMDQVVVQKMGVLKERRSKDTNSKDELEFDHILYDARNVKRAMVSFQPLPQYKKFKRMETVMR